MQGIQLFHYKQLLEKLHRLQTSQMCDSPCEHVALILEHEKKLHEIYTNYKQARDEVGLVIKQFEEHKLTIMRVIAYDKQSRRILLKTRKAEHELTQ